MRCPELAVCCLMSLGRPARRVPLDKAEKLASMRKAAPPGALKSFETERGEVHIGLQPHPGVLPRGQQW